MNTNQIIAQCFGVAMIILCAIAPQFKKKMGFISCWFLANICSFSMFWFLSAYAGAFSAISTIIRLAIFIYYESKQKIVPRYGLIGLILLHSVVICWNFENIYSLFLFFGVANIYGQWRKELKITRICAIITSAGFFLYSMINGAYSGAMNEIIIITSACIALYRFRELNNKKAA